MSTQLIGFSIGGVARRFLVSPPSMIWPANLVNCALFNTLHSQQYAGMGERGGITRERFFAYAFTGAFVWCEPQQLAIVVCDSDCNIVQTSSLAISVSLKRFSMYTHLLTGHSPSTILLLLGDVDPATEY